MSENKPMTVGELIEQLEKITSSAIVEAEKTNITLSFIRQEDNKKFFVIIPVQKGNEIRIIEIG